ncbi:MAG: DegT/DnrJ/EryC1/StrS family aminotransferase, partial [Anaerolineae bacterium]|nr:DegT/DnrJ/EryC1/StrS family aminotransferase [Anaerolineae bacterium]
LSELPEVELPSVRSGIRHAWHLYAIRLHCERLKINRAEFIEHLNSEGIGTSVHFIPLHRQPYYRNRYGLKRSDFPVAEAAFERLISLPLYTQLTHRDIDDVVEAIWRIVQRNRWQAGLNGESGHS